VSNGGRNKPPPKAVVHMVVHTNSKEVHKGTEEA
jgi:hypothetical protein